MGRYAIGILNYFPRELTPRPIQVKVLQEIESSWDSADLFVINLPVASGKSAIATTVAAWQWHDYQLRSSVMVPTNVLLKQYEEDLDSPQDWAVSKRADSYICKSGLQQPASQWEAQWSCLAVKKEVGKYCRGCPLILDILKYDKAPYVLANYHSVVARKLYRPVAIVDEAHLLLPTLREFAARKLWKSTYNYPTYIRDYSGLRRWVETEVERLPGDKKLKTLFESLNSNEVKYLAERTLEKKRGKEEELIRLLPVSLVEGSSSILFPPGKVNKILLMSATLSKKDVEEMKLTQRRVKYIEAESIIPVERRPIKYVPMGNFSYSTQQASLGSFCRDRLLSLLETHKGEKGLIHVPYSLAAKFKELVQVSGNSGEFGGRLLFHDRSDKMKRYYEFRNAPPESGKVLVASGLYEGIDLPQDLGRWQVILKIPYPSLAEPAIKWKLEQDPKWYSWETIKVILQASGRICRTPSDFGVTYIVDESFKRLYDRNVELFPKWYRESIQW